MTPRLAAAARLGPAGLLALAAALLTGCTVPVAEPEARPPARSTNEPGDPDRRARARLELAGAYFGRGQSQTALDEVNQALAAKPDLPEALNLRGLIYASLGEFKLAEDSFQRSLQLNPRDGGAMHNYGWFLCQQRRFPEAQAQFDAALAQPQYRDLVLTMLAAGVCQARAGRWPDAERTLSRAYELDPANPTTAYNLGEVLYRQGDYARARFYLGRINAAPEQASAQSLWLAARIEQRGGDGAAAQRLGRQLRERFPQSPEALQFERGRFDD